MKYSIYREVRLLIRIKIHQDKSKFFLFQFQIIFKVADNQQNESQLLATQAPAINTPRKTYELSRSDVIRPIEDVQSFRTSLELASHKRPVVDEENYREMIRRGHHVKQEASRMSSSSTINAFSHLFISAVMLAILLR